MKKLQVLGPGCFKCQKLAHIAETAARDLGIEYTIEKVTNMEDIMRFGVMMTPALVVDGEVKSVGTLPKPEAMKKLLV